jgi:hypothetical protein
MSEGECILCRGTETDDNLRKTHRADEEGSECS